MKTIKQQENADCGACVLAMALEHRLFDVKVGLRATLYEGVFEWYPTRELISYAAKHGVLMGVFGEIRDGQVQEDQQIEFSWPMKGNRALLVVPSPTMADQGIQHWVYWDGKYVRDPNPKAPDRCRITDYDVLEIWPLISIAEES